MSTKKTDKNTSKIEKAESTFDFQKLVNSPDSYKSLIYGIVTVIVLFIVIALGIRTLQQNKAEIDEEALSTYNADADITTSKYKVVEGDTLWSIAEKSYGDGFKWTEIAKANNITNATDLEKGVQLTIPDLKNSGAETEQISLTATVAPTSKVAEAIVSNPTEVIAQARTITGNTYTVVRDDSLWDIAIRAYGNGYRWVEIAKANNLTNPDLIFSENILKLPRP